MFSFGFLFGLWKVVCCAETSQAINLLEGFSWQGDASAVLVNVIQAPAPLATFGKGASGRI